MNTEELIGPYKYDLTEEENKVIDNYLISLVNEFKNNGDELTKLAVAASATVTASKARAMAMAKQNFIQNIFKNLTGENRKIRGEIDRDFAVAIESAIRMINILHQQQGLTISLVANMNEKVNNIHIDLLEEINILREEIEKIKGNKFLNSETSDIKAIEYNENKEIVNIDKQKELEEKKKEIQYNTDSMNATSLFINGAYNEAANLFEKLIQIDDKNREIYSNLIDCYLHLRDFEKAEHTINKAIQSGFIAFRKDLKMAIIQYKNDCYKEALEILKVCENKNPNNINVLFMIATVYRRLEYYTYSRNYYQKIININDNSAIPYINLSEMAVCGAPDDKKVEQNIWDNHKGCINGVCPHGVRGGEWKKKAVLIEPDVENYFFTNDNKIYPNLIHIDMVDRYLDLFFTN